jgi:hypothetical protein
MLLWSREDSEVLHGLEDCSVEVREHGFAEEILHLRNARNEDCRSLPPAMGFKSAAGTKTEQLTANSGTEKLTSKQGKWP